MNKCELTILSHDKSYFKFGDIFQDLSMQNKNTADKSRPNIEQIESKIFFANSNNRFQYFQRVFTHHSINKYLIVKNLK